MSTDLRSALSSVRELIDKLPDFTREEVDELIRLELSGARRRSVGIRLAQRAARLDADATYHSVMKEFNDVP